MIFEDSRFWGEKLPKTKSGPYEFLELLENKNIFKMKRDFLFKHHCLYNIYMKSLLIEITTAQKDAKIYSVSSLTFDHIHDIIYDI